jgi:tyrosyl-tRNA synthetase
MPDQPPDQTTKTRGEALLDELKERHLYHQCTDEQRLAQHLNTSKPGGVRLYNGFDPTADSLTIGNLVPIMLLRRFRDHGHTPIVLQGGATGLIGDPSGKEAERGLRSREEIEANIDAQRPIFTTLLGDDVEIVNNDDWFRDKTVYWWLREVGKYFSVSQMIARDSVRNRLEREQGISYTEFSYMLLQAYDFLHLFKDKDVTLQTAGADQWGNIVSGCDLIRREQMVTEQEKLEKEQSEQISQGEEPTLVASYTGRVAYGLTAPLLTKSDGSKFGKTESGAVWLSHIRPSGEPGTSPYAYYQFWLNAADADVVKYLRIFTDRPLDEIADLEQRHAAEPHKREAQRTLARDATTLLHGRDAMENAEHAATALFSGDVRSLDPATLDEVFAEVPTTTHDRGALDEPGADLIDLLAQTSLVSSKSEARKQLRQNAIAVNGEKIAEGRRLTREDLLHGRVLLLRRGKKHWHLCRFG